MTRLLHLSASPRGQASESLALADAYLAEVIHRPDLEIDHWDLWDGSLPDFGPEATGAKMSVFAGQEPSGAQAAAWERALAAFRRFDSADAYLLSVPMWNGGVPYVLKQFIDVVSQPGYVFGFDAEAGYSGLLTGKKAVLVLTSAVYGAGRPEAFGIDFQRPYLEWWLGWAGIEDVTTIEFRPDLATDRADELRAAALEQVRDAALKL
ncbi:FMN-dependent NADH-azoreductase [Intrasporangium sp.]|uniref:FMN-dependent NADH-azoreductase n=1 Tax=Intrasporangium sp. TaxID=1925024 RepID=UPI00293B76AE|nr:NAD(P)H-dependent oxidoreductase [Intrasporangium sp.]MDV3222400.1 NAD(P)H-dependent oxidoreductase [Intrasporangium sp.]